MYLSRPEAPGITLIQRQAAIAVQPPLTSTVIEGSTTTEEGAEAATLNIQDVDGTSNSEVNKDFQEGMSRNEKKRRKTAEIEELISGEEVTINVKKQKNTTMLKEKDGQKEDNISNITEDTLPSTSRGSWETKDSEPRGSQAITVEEMMATRTGRRRHDKDCFSPDNVS